MELREYFKLLTKYWEKVLLSGVVFGVLAYTISSFFPTKFQALVTVYVQRVPEKSPAGDYTYDGFYAQKAAEAYTDTVFGFLEGRDILQRAAKVANLPSDPESLKGFVKKVKIEKIAPQLIEVKVTLGDKEVAKNLVLALAQSAQERVSLLNQEGDTSLTVNLANPEPLVTEVKLWKELNAVVGFFAGLLLIMSLIFFVEYLKADNSNSD